MSEATVVTREPRVPGDPQKEKEQKKLPGGEIRMKTLNELDRNRTPVFRVTGGDTKPLYYQGLGASRCAKSRFISVSSADFADFCADRAIG